MVAQAERELVQEQLEDLRSSCSKGGGLLPGEEVVSYYPPEMEQQADLFGLAGTNIDGTQWETGDTEARFPLHSISKVFTYGMALEDNGLDATLRRVGVEPSGDPFNSITFDEVNNRPFNPMINAGALVSANLVHGASKEERVDRLLERYRIYTGNSSLEVDQKILAEQLRSNDRNLGLSYLMRSLGMLHGDIDDNLFVYLSMCSITVTTSELSMMAATLAHGGRNPITGDRALHHDHLRTVISVMNMCGMYDAAGEWAHDVGIPAKSGVSGGIMAVLPNYFGLGVFSPGLDRHGNSVRGIAVCRELSARFGLHVFADPNDSRFGRVAQPELA
ncbi:glutaminase A [Pseudonocardia nematodicida]|uniref:Glutaminase n=1 Tax=Pseudonocardia nematodicida TaxID=1206997 RepID=A0ABV1K3Y2_9PSEU